MFGHKKNDSKTLTEHNSLTIIGEHCTIEGNISSKTALKIDGMVLGNINIDGNVILGEKGHIKGDINSKEAIIYGQIDGNLNAQKAQLKASAKIAGNINTESLQIDPGAHYQGTVTMQKNQNTAATAEKTLKAS